MAAKVLSSITLLLLMASGMLATSALADHGRVSASSTLHHQLYRSKNLRDTGAGAAATVVLIHGWSCDSSYWDAQLAALDRYDVLTLDLAGHGRSPRGEHPGTMAAFGQDVASLLTALPTDQPLILVGHSMGGPVAIETALLLGDRVRGVIGVDTFSTLTAPPTPPAEVTRRLQAFERDFASTTAAFVSQSFFRTDADPVLKSRIVASMAAGDPVIGMAAIRGLNDWQGLDRAQQLQRPIVAINADQAPIDVAAIRSRVPQFSATIVSGLGHFLMMEDPARFNPLLIDTIEALLPTD